MLHIYKRVSSAYLVSYEGDYYLINKNVDLKMQSSNVNQMCEGAD